jgi:HSP20 family molecular chaperone IbpA
MRQGSEGRDPGFLITHCRLKEMVMSRIAIQMFRNELAPSFVEEAGKLFDAIRQRAFSLFELRGFSPGRDLDDWLAAEREILWSPPVEMIENEKEFRIQIAVPGCEAKDIQITALPESIVVQTEPVRTHEKEEGTTHISEIGTRKLYRRLDLPSPIDLETITATLDRGLLRLMVPKAAPTAEKKIHVTAAGQTA